MAKNHHRSNRTKARTNRNKTNAKPEPPVVVPPTLPTPNSVPPNIKTRYVPPQPAQRLLPLEDDDGPSTMSDSPNTATSLLAPSPATVPLIPEVDQDTEMENGNPQAPQPDPQDPFTPNQRPSKRRHDQVARNEPHPPQTPTKLPYTRLSATIPSHDNSHVNPLSPSPTAGMQLRTSTPFPTPNPRGEPLTSRPTAGNNVCPDVDITGLSGENPLIDLLVELKDGWKGIDQPKLLAVPYRATYSDEHKFQTADQIKTAISHALGGATPEVLAPERSPSALGAASTYRPPWCYLITDLQEDDVDLLVSNKFISNQFFGVQLLPFSPPPSGYIASIRGLTWKKNSDAPAVENLIRKTIEDNILHRMFISDFVADKNDRIPREVVGQGLAAAWTVGTIRAYLHTQGEENTPSAVHLWRWYIYTPCSKDEDITAWTNRLKPLFFNAITKGWGTPYDIDRCTGCKSTNHSTSGCPFPKKFPQLNETNPAPSRAQGRGRGRTAKDRGRGREGRGRGRGFRNTSVA